MRSIRSLAGWAAVIAATAVSAQAVNIGRGFGVTVPRGTAVSEGKSHVNADLSGHSFANLDLAGHEFVNVDLSKADFRRARLGGASFVNANLSGADFRGANLKGASFVNVDWDGADFSGAVWLNGRTCAPRSIGRCR